MKFAWDLFLASPFLFAMPQQSSARSRASAWRIFRTRPFCCFTPHPDDDVFGAGGTIALLNRNHNKVIRGGLHERRQGIRTIPT